MTSTTAISKLVPNDPRVEHSTAQVNGKTYYYIVARPPTGTPPKATILLIHGFPDLGFGWRNQVPFLAAQGFLVVVPDKLGYGQTDSPADVEPYRIKSVVDDLLAILDAKDLVVVPQGGRAGPAKDRRFILGGHDWGGQVVWRFTEWYPQRIAAVFSICTPYFRSLDTFVDLPALTQMVPTFNYQLQFASGELVERTSKPDGTPDRAVVKDLLNALYGAGVPHSSGDDPNRPKPFVATKGGVNFSAIQGLPKTPLMTDEELDFYTDQYSRNGLRGPTNWYRTRRLNFDDELVLVEARKKYAEETGEDLKIKTPALFIAASRDVALPPALSKNMEESFENLSRGHVDASHWALVEAADEVNGLVADFLSNAFKPKSSM